MTRRFSWLTGLAVIAGLAGCPDNPYKSDTWIKKLGDQREAERAVTELEQLGDPAAIEPLGEAWVKQGKPVRMLQVVISLARPLTPKEAEEKFFTDYQQTGRPANWDKALPYLKRALSEVDESNQRSVDSVMKAAEALGEARLPEGLDALIELTQKPLTKKLAPAQVAAIRAIGKYNQEAPKAAGALVKIIDREAPPHPRTAKDKEQIRGLEEKYGLFLSVSGSAINALGDLRVASAAKPLVLSMFRTPELFTQIRRALVATGPTAEDELRKVLAGNNAEVNQLFRDKKLDKYCGDKGDAPQDQCQPVSAMAFYPAVVLGDFYDPKSVGELLGVLHQRALPVYYMDDQPSPNTQYNAVFDALRKIGSPEGAATVRAMWSGKGGAAAPAPAKGGKPGTAGPATGGASDLNTRVMAIGAYPFLTRDDTGLEDLGKIAADNTADDSLRQEAATAFARMSHDAKDISVLEGLAQKYFDAAAKKRAEADKHKPEADKADKDLDKAKKTLDDAKAAVLRATHKSSKSADEVKAATDDIKTATAAAKKAEDDFKVAKQTHKTAVEPYKSADGGAKAYKGYGRMFQTHIARIEIAIRCNQDINCYAGSLKLKPEDAARNAGKYIKDIKDWTKEEQAGLVEANIERAMLEIGKRGQAAGALTETLLDNATSDNRVIRQSILLALPKIAKVPCNDCETKLQAAIKAGEGKTTLGDLNLETTMMKNYFGWAGGKTPSSSTPADKEDLSAPAPAPRKK
ncbi:MAG TPA: hypothetical protein VGC42_29520 [Kofleriaceae bacterium]